MKRFFVNSLIIAVLCVSAAFMVSCGGGGSSSGTSGAKQENADSGGKLSGTYVSKDGRISYTFSGKNLTAEAYGQKSEATFELKDGKLVMTSADGKTESYPYTLEGDTFTYDWNGTKIVLTKK